MDASEKCKGGKPLGADVKVRQNTKTFAEMGRPVKGKCRGRRQHENYIVCG